MSLFIFPSGRYGTAYASLTGGAFQVPSDLDERHVVFQGTLSSLAGVPLVYTSFGMDRGSLLFLCRIWRLLVIRQPLTDSDGETPRRINGVVQSPQHLWGVGCRIYMTAVPDVFPAWRTEAKWPTGTDVRDAHVRN